MPTVKDILTDYLKQHGYDGLCHVETECGCPVEDLCLCDSYMMECKPAVKFKCTDDDCELCDGGSYHQGKDRYHYVVPTEMPCKERTSNRTLRKVLLSCPSCGKGISVTPEAKVRYEMLKHIGGGTENTVIEQTIAECPFCELDIRVTLKWSE